MKHFNNDFLAFLAELKENNERPWFQENKKRYEQEVKEPFKSFVETLISEMGDLIPGMEFLEAKACIFRIYRDIRFSKDKTPYKEHVSAAIVSGGRKEMIKPGMYLQISSNEMRLYSGCYQADKNQLRAIRSAIAYDIPGFQKMVKNKKFVAEYGEIRGEKNKRLPVEFREAAELEPLIFNKQFYYFKSFPAETVLDKNLIKILKKSYRVILDLNKFLEEALEDANHQ